MWCDVCEECEYECVHGGVCEGVWGNIGKKGFDSRVFS
jgi:hypothetical protein